MLQRPGVIALKVTVHPIIEWLSEGLNTKTHKLFISVVTLRGEKNHYMPAIYEIHLDKHIIFVSGCVSYPNQVLFEN